MDPKLRPEGEINRQKCVPSLCLFVAMRVVLTDGAGSYIS